MNEDRILIAIKESSEKIIKEIREIKESVFRIEITIDETAKLICSMGKIRK